MSKETFYNIEYKLEYLDLMESEDVKNRHTSIFKRTSKFEKELNKDIFDMTRTELDGTFRRMKFPSTASASQTISYLNKYILWAVHNGYSSSRSLRYPNGITREIALEFTFKSSKTLYTYEEIKNALSKIDDIRYRTCLMCVFEGINGDYASEIINLKMSDIQKLDNGAIVTLRNRDNLQIPISEELYWLLDNTNELTHLQIFKGKLELAPSPYIFKKAKRKGESEDDVLIKSPFRTRAIEEAKIELDNKKMRVSNFTLSGMCKLSSDLMNEKEERVLTMDILEVIGVRYNIDMSVKSTFISKMMEDLDEDFITESYGEFRIEL